MSLTVDSSSLSEVGVGGEQEEEDVSLYHQCVSVQDSEKNSSTNPERKDVSVQLCYINPFTLCSSISTSAAAITRFI